MLYFMPLHATSAWISSSLSPGFAVAFIIDVPPLEVKLKAEKRFLAAIAAASEMLTSIVPSACRYDFVLTEPLTGGVALRGTMLALTVISSDPSAFFWTSLIVTVLVHQCLELSGEYLS